MTSQHDADQRIKAFLQPGPTELPDASFDVVRSHIERTPQRVVIGPWRTPDMPNLARIALAAAAVVVVAFGATQLLLSTGGRPGDPPRPIVASPSPSPSVTSRASPAASADGQVLRVDDPFPVAMSLMAGPGWQLWGDAGIGGIGWYKDSPDPPAGLGVTVWTVDRVYAEPCGPDGAVHDPPIGPTVDDLADALVAQPDTIVDVDEPTTLDGYAGRYLEYTADLTGCTDGILRRWATAGGVTRDALDDEHDSVWIIDVDGTRVVIDTFDFPGTTVSDLAEARAMVESIDIDGR